MSDDDAIVQQEVGTAIAVIVKADPLVRGIATLRDIEDGMITVVTSDAEQAEVGDHRLRLRKAIRHVETSITDLFRPRKMFEKLLREHFKTTYLDPMNAAVEMIDRELLAWDTEKVRRVQEERERLEREAKAAAEAVQREHEAAVQAAAEAKAQVDAFEEQGRHDEAVALQGAFELQAAAVAADEPPPFEAQPVPVPEAARSVKGAEATTFVRRTLLASLEDPIEAMQWWPEAFVFDEKKCAKLFDDVGGARPKDNESVVVRGVRFTVQVGISGKGR